MKKSELKQLIKEVIQEIQESVDKFTVTANQLLGISDDWTASDIKEHLHWLIENPDEIADGYDKSVFKYENINKIMNAVKKLITER